MGYWDKRETKPVEEEPEEEITLSDYEKGCAETLGEMERSFRDRMKKENKRFQEVTDTGYWFAVCFTSREQREEFMKKIGLEPDLLYVDGREMAKAYKKALATPDLEFPKTQPFGKEYLERVREV